MKNAGFRNRRMEIPVPAFLFSAVLLVAVLLTECSPRRPHLPDHIGSLTRAAAIDGRAADDIINRMHGKDLPSAVNSIGMYTGAEGNAVTYLSVYASAGEAGTAFGAMEARIERGTPVFREFHHLSLDGGEVSFCSGLGQHHYFFISNNIVCWLSVDSTLSRDVVVDFMRAVVD